MESEKVKEIKETLKRCGSGKDGCCWGCSLQDTQNIAKCTTVLCDKALTLINELESENEELAKARKRVTEINEELSNKHKKIEKQLKDRIAELEKVSEELTKQVVKITGCSVSNEEVDYECNKKLKQFAERLKEKVIRPCDLYDCVTFDDIDETLKEFINKGE